MAEGLEITRGRMAYTNISFPYNPKNFSREDRVEGAKSILIRQISCPRDSGDQYSMTGIAFLDAQVRQIGGLQAPGDHYRTVGIDFLDANNSTLRCASAFNGTKCAPRSMEELDKMAKQILLDTPQMQSALIFLKLPLSLFSSLSENFQSWIPESSGNTEASSDKQLFAVAEH